MDNSTDSVAITIPAVANSSQPAALSATQRKKLAKANQPYIAPVDANGERLYARKVKAPPQKQRRDLIAEQNPNRTNIRRWGHTCNTVQGATSENGTVDERIIAFGGWGADAVGQSRTVDHRLNSMAVLQPSISLAWQSPTVKGTLPAAREQHTAVVIPAVPSAAVDPESSSSTSGATASPAPLSFSSLSCRSPHLLVFGGRSNPSHAMSDIALLNLESYEWMQLPQPILGEGVTPENLARFRHTAVWASHRMIVYGGCRYESMQTTESTSSTTVAPPPSPSLSPSIAMSHTVYSDFLIVDTSVSPMRWQRLQTPGVPAKHSHVAAYCCTSQSVYFYGGYSDAESNGNQTDNSLYRLSISSSDPAEWTWQCISHNMTGTPPPPLSSGSMHVLSPRFLLLVGGVSCEDMYALSSLWVADLHERTWSRPFLHPGTHTRFHPALERPMAWEENRVRGRFKAGDEIGQFVAQPDTDDSMGRRLAESKDPVRIVEHAFICKHAAVLVSEKFLPDDIDLPTQAKHDSLSSSSPAVHQHTHSHRLILCGGGGNVFHFNPFFNPTLQMKIHTRESQVSADEKAFEALVDISVAPVHPTRK